MIAFEPFGAVGDARLALDAAARDAFSRALARCADSRAAQRLWDRDHTLWKPSPAEIANRLGWLRSPAAMRGALAGLADFVAEVRAEGIRDVLVLGMGGSSLAPELFSATFAPAPGHPTVAVLDCTDPGAVRAAERRCDPRTTLYLVSTKSGGTVETLSFFKYFYALAVERLGVAAGRQFAAVTDPGSTLEEMARRIGARRVFLNDPDVGGRFSALTLFGLVPAALGGVDLARLLDSADAMAKQCRADAPDVANPGVMLGALAGGLAGAGRDKLTLVCSDAIAGFGSWAEQLVAESTGKEGRGILPVVAERFGPGRRFGADRLFVFLVLEGDEGRVAALEQVAAAGHPVLVLPIADPYALGGEFFRWEFATAIAGSLLDVNPFDQPDVESAKVQANRALTIFRQRGSLPEAAEEVAGAEAAGAISGLIASARPGDYLAVQAFVDPAGLAGSLRAFTAALGDRSGLAVTLGYGPRFLHSTGQLHKGGPDGGIFIQLVTVDPDDICIPDDFGSRSGAVGFGVLKAAQSLGDLRALEAAGRRVVRVNLGPGGLEAVGLLDRITRAVQAQPAAAKEAR